MPVVLAMHSRILDGSMTSRLLYFDYFEAAPCPNRLGKYNSFCRRKVSEHERYGSTATRHTELLCPPANEGKQAVGFGPFRRVLAVVLAVRLPRTVDDLAMRGAGSSDLQTKKSNKNMQQA